MATEQRGAAHWIDHFVVGTNDIGRWVEWAIDVIGVERHPIGGLTTEARNAGRPVASFMYMGDGSCHFGAFLQREQLLLGEFPFTLFRVVFHLQFIQLLKAFPPVNGVL